MLCLSVFCFALKLLSVLCYTCKLKLIIVVSNVCDPLNKGFSELYLGVGVQNNTEMTTSKVEAMAGSETNRADYRPPWADVSIIGVAGSSGSGKSTLSHALVSALNLPWVVILSMVWFSSFRNP